MELIDILKSGDVDFIKLNGTLNFTDASSDTYGQSLVIGNNGFVTLENKLSNKKVFKITNNSDILIGTSDTNILTYTLTEEIKKEQGSYNFFIAVLNNSITDVEYYTLTVVVDSVIKRTFNFKIAPDKLEEISLSGAFNNDLPSGTSIDIKIKCLNGNGVIKGTTKESVLVLIKALNVSLFQELDKSNLYPILNVNVASNNPKISEINSALNALGISTPLTKQVSFIVVDGNKSWLIIWDGTYYLYEKLGRCN